MRMKKVFIVAFSLLSILGCKESKKEMPPQKIKVVAVEKKDVDDHNRFVGEVSGRRDIPIRARVDGFLETINFKEGGRVNKGDLLYTIDAQSYLAAVAVSKSGVAEAKTQLVKAQSDYNRIKPLADKNALSQSDLDAAIAQLDAAKAYVDAAKADLRMSNINLSYTRLRSPISGVIGKTKAKIGEYVGKDPNPVILNVVSQIDEMLIDIFIPEAQYIKLDRTVLRLKEEGKLKDLSDRFTTKLELSDGSIFEHIGKVQFVDREVNANTGTILMQFKFPNPDKLLRPGMYGKVDIIFNRKNTLVIPERVIFDIQGTKNVYVVNKEGLVELRPVSTHKVDNGYNVVDSGVEEGEQIVYEGIQLVRPKMKVIPEIIVYEPKPEKAE